MSASHEPEHARQRMPHVDPHGEPRHHDRQADDSMPQPGPQAGRQRAVIIGGVVLLLALVVVLYLVAKSRTNHVALSQAPKPVTVEKARAEAFQPMREYVGTTDAWNTAKVGPQYVSAYVGTVLVRPGAMVKRGEVLATLDCRYASAGSKEMAARAKALEQRQMAIAHETERTKELVAGGFASANEVEQLGARTASEAAEIESLKAGLVSKNIEVDDCILRAPFLGEVTERYVDPGAYLHPGMPVVTVIDRHLVRVSADAPEDDFAIVAAGNKVEITLPGTNEVKEAPISRRAPAADSLTRTVHFEIDLDNASRAIPAGATVRVHVPAGEPLPAMRIPVSGAKVRNDKASVFTVENGKAVKKTVKVLGERGGDLFVEPKLGPVDVVIEGGALLMDGDAVTAKESADGGQK